MALTKDDPHSAQQALRTHLEARQRERADPHATAVEVLGYLKYVGEGLQSYRETLPLLAEVGDTLSAVAALVDGLCGQLDSVKAQLVEASAKAGVETPYGRYRPPGSEPATDLVTGKGKHLPDPGHKTRE